MFDTNENWFRTNEHGGVDHVMFTVIEGRYVQIEIGLWRDILDTLGFKPELTAEELDGLTQT